MILNYLFRVDKLEEIVERELPVHVVGEEDPLPGGRWHSRETGGTKRIQV